MKRAGFLLDVNALVALADRSHVHHDRMSGWFDSEGSRSWGVCAVTEAGFLRVVTRPTVGALSMEDATLILKRYAGHPGYRFWPVANSWIDLVRPFEPRIFGHQQITDAFLLGLAVKEDGVLVTLDKAIGHIAGAEYQQNVLFLAE